MTLAIGSTIARMSTMYGVSLRTLRFYEQRGLLKPTRIGSKRYYTARDDVRLQLILKGKKLGFSLVEIEALLHNRQSDADDICGRLSKREIARQIKMLERRRAGLNESIAELKGRLADDTWEDGC